MPKRKQSDLSKREGSFPSENEWSKSKKKRMRRLKSKQSWNNFPEKTTNLDSLAMEKHSNKLQGVKIDSSVMVTPSIEPKGIKTSSALQQSFMARLTGSRFRELNEVSSLLVAKQETVQSIAVSVTHNHINTFTILYRNCTRRHLLLHSSGSLRIQNCTNNITMDSVTKWSSGLSILWM